MARKFVTPVDLTGNELLNAVAQTLASAPSTNVTPGRFYYDSTSGKFVYRNASTWVDPTSRSSHTGTQLASTISDFDTQVRTNRLDQLAVPTTSVSFNGQRITNLAAPSAGTDAATKTYVDNVVNATNWKNAVRVATTANITLSGLQTIDGITLVAGDRVLVKNQSTASQNGIYVVASGAWARSTDADENAEVTTGLAVVVTEGTTQAGGQYRLSTTGTIVVGTTALTFAQFGTGTSYTQGTGISISGNVISIDTAVVTRKVSASIGNGSATSINVNHGLGTLDVVVQVYEISTGETVDCDVTRSSTSQVTLGFAVAPTNNQYRVVVQG